MDRVELKQYRDKLGKLIGRPLSQRRLAAMLDLDNSTLYRYEKGIRRIPKLLEYGLRGLELELRQIKNRIAVLTVKGYGSQVTMHRQNNKLLFENPDDGLLTNHAPGARGPKSSLPAFQSLVAVIDKTDKVRETLLDAEDGDVLRITGP